MTTTSTAADHVVATLRSYGVDAIFALPGEENLPVVSALAETDIEVVVCRHEQHAAFMAVAHARLTGGLGVCLATLGPGALNLFTGLAQAQLMRVPVLAITGQKRRLDNDEGPFQVVDVVGSARPIVVHAVSIDDPATAAVRISDAVLQALSTPGPVLVELPEDVSASELDHDPTPSARPAATPAPAPAAIEELDAAFAAAERPILLAGAGCANPEIARQLQDCCEKTGLGVVMTQMGIGALPSAHPRAIGSIGMHRPDYVHAVIDSADVVICVGYQPVEHPPLAWRRRDQRIIHVHSQGADVEPGYVPDLQVVGDIGATLGRLSPAGFSAWTDAYRNAIRACLADELQDAPDNSVALVPRRIGRAVSDDTVVALDNGLYKLWFARHYAAGGPRSLLLDNALATMGAGLASGMAAARLGHPAVVVTGDGGFLMNVADLETAVRLGLDLTIVVLRDDRFGFIAWHQREQGRAETAVDLGNPDLAMLAKAFGADHRSVGTVDELEDEIRKGHKGVVVIDFPVDYACVEILERTDLVEQVERRLD